ncbi:MAG: hypothetical protein IJV64_05790 [Oscillospiraceae bacterium]|nr:hypothetical protein [Oscillospiraceae bacterium]
METENELPFGLLEDDIGEIVATEQLGPGVYYIAARNLESGLPCEYYVARSDTPALSEQAKAYGRPVPGCPALLLYVLDVAQGGSTIVKYEAQKYRAAHGLPLLDEEDVLTTAVYGMEHYPDYFGGYPAPLHTPRGATTRHKSLAPGIYAIETDRFERLIAVCYPVWSCDLSDYTVAAGEQTEYDAEHGIDNTLGYLFFPESAGCLALFELWKWYDEIMASGMIDRTAMMNAIYLNHLEYAVMHNKREQEGLNDAGAHFWRWLGYDVEPEGSEENLITLTPEAGAKYLKF